MGTELIKDTDIVVDEHHMFMAKIIKLRVNHLIEMFHLGLLRRNESIGVINLRIDSHHIYDIFVQFNDVLGDNIQMQMWVGQVRPPKGFDDLLHHQKIEAKRLGSIEFISHSEPLETTAHVIVWNYIYQNIPAEYWDNKRKIHICSLTIQSKWKPETIL